MTQPAPKKRVQCQQCLAVTQLDDGEDPHAHTWCGCCTQTDPETGQPHHHGRAAEACPGNGGAGHEGAPCPHPNPAVCIRLTPAGEDCPGGHCGIGVDGCTVCRPVVHFATVGQILAGT
jgi:hypothetical protein